MPAASSPRPPDLSRAASVMMRACLAGTICLAPGAALAQRAMGFGFCAPPLRRNASPLPALTLRRRKSTNARTTSTATSIPSPPIAFARRRRSNVPFAKRTPRCSVGSAASPLRHSVRSPDNYSIGKATKCTSPCRPATRSSALFLPESFSAFSFLVTSAGCATGS